MSVVTTNDSGLLASGNKPSVYDIVELIGHGSAPILEMIGKTKAAATVHSWIVDNIGDINLSYPKEIDAPAKALEYSKQKTSNAVQIFKTTASVSFDQEASAVYGSESEESHQKKKAAKIHLMKQEGAFLGIGRESLYDAPEFRQANSFAGKSAGIAYYLTLDESAFSKGRRGNILAVDSAKDGTGTPGELNIDIIDEFAAIPYENNARMTDIFLGANLKRKFNKLFARQLSNEKNANLDVVTVELTTGTARVHLHPYMTDKYGLGDAIIGGDFSFAKWAVLQEKNRELPTGNSAKEWEYYLSGCAQITNAKAFAMLIGAKQ